MSPTSSRRQFIKLGGAAGASAFVGLAGCTGGGQQEQDGQQDQGGGNEGAATGTPETSLSGPVVEYGTEPFPEAEKAFKEKTGVEVKSVGMPGFGSISRFIKEANAGESTADFLNVQGTFVANLKEHRDWIVGFDNPSHDKIYHDGLKAGNGELEAAFNDIWEGATRDIHPFLANMMGNAYHEDKVDDPPTTHEDFLRSEFKDRIATPPYTMRNAVALMEAQGMELSRIEEIIKGIDAQNPKYGRSMDSMVKQIPAQEVDVVYNILTYNAGIVKADGAPIGATYFPYTSSGYKCGLVTNRGKASEAAKEYVKFLTSQEGQEILQRESAGEFPIFEGMDHGNDYLQGQFEKYVETVDPHAMVKTLDEENADREKISNWIDI